MPLYPNATPSPGYPLVPLIQNGDAVGGELTGPSNKSAIALAERTENLRMMGIMPHDVAFNYPIGAFVQSGGVVYKSRAVNVNKSPAANANDWDKCAMTLSELLAVLGLGTGSAVGYDVQNPSEAQRVQALTNLGILDLVKGSDYKNSVRCVITSTVSLTGTVTSTVSDNLTLVNGDPVLYAPTTASAAAGIYIYNTAGAWARRTDANESIEVTSGMEVAVEDGTLYKDTKWTLTTDGAIVLGTTPLTYAQIGSVYKQANAVTIDKSQTNQVVFTAADYSWSNTSNTALYSNWSKAAGGASWGSLVGSTKSVSVSGAYFLLLTGQISIRNDSPVAQDIQMDMSLNGDAKDSIWRGSVPQNGYIHKRVSIAWMGNLTPGDVLLPFALYVGSANNQLTGTVSNLKLTVTAISQ